MVSKKPVFPICRSALVALLGAVLLMLAVPRAAFPDDRDLLRDSTGDPYVFILLDTSGSMNWTPRCTQAQLDAGDCTTLCPLRDCFARLQADDPSSKFYQAKEALYEVLKSVDDIQFGFATYNQDDLTAWSKHWLYKAGTGGVTLPGAGSRVFPAPGADDVFGRLWNCDTGGGDHNIGCDESTPADLDNAWETARMQRLPKGGTDFDQDVSFFIRWSGNTFLVRYRPTGSNVPGAATIQVRVRVDRCTNTNCTTTTNIGEPTITYSLGFTNGRPDEFLSWDNAGNDPNRTPTNQNPTITYFPQTDNSGVPIAADPTANNTCAGWDPNSNDPSGASPSGSSDDDTGPDTTLRFPDGAADSRGWWFRMGDRIPLDWQLDHKTDILRRLAPNQITDPTADPDFRIATYLRDVPASGDSSLLLDSNNVRPLIASGSTPLGFSVKSFRTWYAGCAHGSCNKGTGWKHVASAQDPDWGCRKKFLLVITDGDDTCPGEDPCSFTASLRSQEGILTYVVAFGVENTSGNRLNCMAANGGTGDPIYPQNKQDLVNALTAIFTQIREQTSSFASAAVPTVQTEVADKVYISNFTPLNGEATWDGHVDAFLKPLPLTRDGLPDRSRTCPAVSTPANPRSACHLWDAGTRIESQAPLLTDLASIAAPSRSELQLGNADLASQRRVFHGMARSGDNVPTDLRLFDLPSSDTAWQDFLDGFRLPRATAAQEADSKLRATGIVKQALGVKESTVQSGTGAPIPVEWVLGDTFHADPTVFDQPADFQRFSQDLYTNGQPCGENGLTKLPRNPGYRCFSLKHQLRRKILTVASNDGQIHFFDAGTWRTSDNKFTDGTGQELLSFMPRGAMPILRFQFDPDDPHSKHVFALDSTPRIDEVFIDPQNTGTGAASTDPPVAAEREWRTVLIGGFREGGSPFGGSRLTDVVSGYYALDITQPDQLDAQNKPTLEPGSFFAGTLPSCLTLDNTAVATPNGCGRLPFPALLWEFNDKLLGARLDEDRNGTADLGQTWSVPTVGRIRVKDAAGTVLDRFVAIFGGGMDAENKAAPKSGNFLYMVDVETGQPIYKRQITGATPAEPAVIDNDNDGVLDTVYIGTTAGLVYKVDMSQPALLKDDVTLTTNQALPAFAASQTVRRVVDQGGISWAPFPVFDTGGKPIYFAPTVAFVSKLDRNALAFGAGDREDLWNLTGQEGRFYIIVDEGFTASQVGSTLPRNESQYTQLTPTSPAATNDFVLTPQAGKSRGWFLRLESNERVITSAFALGGLIIFTSYEPDVVTATPGPSGPVCGRTGTSRAYTVLAGNANPLLATSDRFQEVPVVASPPTVDRGQTKNPANPAASLENLTSEQLEIMQKLKGIFPKACKFGNYYWNVYSMGSDTRVVGIAAIPICITEQNWKDIG